MLRDAEDVLNRAGEIYLALIHADESTALVVQPLLELASELSPGLALNMIREGESWRERLLGLVLAAREDPAAISSAILDNLKEPRGIAVTPSCAALAALSTRVDTRALTEGHLAHIDLSALDGEVGWALDQVRSTEAMQSLDSARSPNCGQSFASQLAFYSALYSSAR